MNPLLNSMDLYSEFSVFWIIHIAFWVVLSDLYGDKKYVVQNQNVIFHLSKITNFVRPTVSQSSTYSPAIESVKAI